MFSFENLTSVLSLVAVGLGTLWGVVKWLLARQDALKDSLERQREVDREAVKRAHERLDRIPENFIRRDEVMQHFTRLEGQLGEMRRDVTSRLDSLVDRLIGINKET